MFQEVLDLISSPSEQAGDSQIRERNPMKRANQLEVEIL
jgi:hypothetical protein